MGYGGKLAARTGDVRRFNFTGNGSNTAFDLGFAPATQNQLIVTINGVVQHYDAFSVTGSTITFTGTPAAGDYIQVTAVVDAIGVMGIADGAVANVSTLRVTTTPMLVGNAVGTFSNPLIQAASTANSWVQINAQNLNNGNNASTDLILARSDGNDYAGYIDMGINSNTYNQSTYSIMQPGSGYLFVNGGDLSIGTQTNNNIIFHTGNTTSSSERMRITSNGAIAFPDTTQFSTGYSLGMRNRIINGAMNIWQRGTSFTVSTSTVTYGADRWGIYQPSGTGTVTRDTDAPNGFKYSLKAVGAGTDVLQRIESFNVADLYGASVAVSFWVKQTVGAGTGSISVALLGLVNPDDFTNSISISTQTITPTASWALYSIVFSNLPASVVNGLSLNIFPTSSGSSSTFYITGVQLERGSTATPFEYRPYGAELALCQRYFQTYKTSAYIGGPLAANSNRVGLPLLTPPMRSGPVWTFYDMNGTSGQLTEFSSQTSRAVSLYSSTSASGGGYVQCSTSFTNACEVRFVVDAEL